MRTRQLRVGSARLFASASNHLQLDFKLDSACSCPPISTPSLSSLLLHDERSSSSRPSGSLEHAYVPELPEQPATRILIKCTIQVAICSALPLS